ncbi:hypothetical protein SELMODRAFT_416299 [Selaginella moellendorffii]|uniref:Uncharacterized protein n=1 Tax=Selaginella moellendorffii TaxID=88036 RepID=D8RYV0_SELML|nr:hypothetical protein SELMODRAFT_416299 [Selaginella moellendorffii]
MWSQDLSIWSKLEKLNPERLLKQDINMKGIDLCRTPYRAGRLPNLGNVKHLRRSNQTKSCLQGIKAITTQQRINEEACGATSSRLLASTPPRSPSPRSLAVEKSISIAVSYTGKDTFADGTLLTCPQTAIHPNVMVPGDVDPAQLYSIVMIDRRASQSMFTLADQFTYVHYWIANIPGSKVDAGTILEEYMRPAPHDFMQHKYEFILYKQQGQINTPLADRFVKDWEAVASAYNLGSPVATTSFVAQLTLNFRTRMFQC